MVRKRFTGSIPVVGSILSMISFKDFISVIKTAFFNN